MRSREYTNNVNVDKILNISNLITFPKNIQINLFQHVKKTDLGGKKTGITWFLTNRFIKN